MVLNLWEAKLLALEPLLLGGGGGGAMCCEDGFALLGDARWERRLTEVMDGVRDGGRGGFAEWWDLMEAVSELGLAGRSESTMGPSEVDLRLSLSAPDAPRRRGGGGGAGPLGVTGVDADPNGDTVGIAASSSCIEFEVPDVGDAKFERSWLCRLDRGGGGGTFFGGVVEADMSSPES